MTGLDLQLRASDQNLSGTPAVVDIIDQNLRVVTQQTVIVGVRHHFDLPVGNYGLRLLLPSGLSLTDTAVVTENYAYLHVMDLLDITARAGMERTAFLKPPSHNQPMDLDDARHRSAWFRLWVRSERAWNVERRPAPTTQWETGTVHYWIEARHRQLMLQFGGPRVPWTMVSLPAADRLEITIRPASGEARGLAATVATDNNQVEALLGYLTVGALAHASLVERESERQLLDKSNNAATAAVRGYYLLRVSDLERLRNRPTAGQTEWMPDGDVINAWQLLRELQEAPTQPLSAFQTARARLLDTVDHGIPVYTEGLRLLVSGLKLVDSETGGRDREVTDALGKIGPFSEAADLGQPTTTFRGLNPLTPSPSPMYGVPEDRDGLVFLRPESPLSTTVERTTARQPRPYFFFSYAHTPPDPNERYEPDQWIVRLYRTLCQNVAELTGSDPSTCGFMDSEIPAGRIWSSELERALANCRVFVPLYSPRYFSSEQCGKEWAAFSQRQLYYAAGTGNTAQAIVPALWVPVSPPQLPQVAASIASIPGVEDTSYRADGFYGIMKRRGLQNSFNRAVSELARTIVTTAAQIDIPSASSIDYASLASVFTSSRDTRNDGYRFRLTVVSQDLAHLPSGRNSNYYGRTALDWNPYQPEVVVPIAEYSGQLTKLQGLEPDVGILDEHADELLSGDGTNRPGIMLVNPWATINGRSAELRLLDRLNRPWNTVLVPWSHQDLEAMRSGDRLRQGLNSCLGSTLAQIPRRYLMAGTGVPTLQDFNYLFPAMVSVVVRRFLSEAPPSPGLFTQSGRPRLRGPVNEGQEDRE